MKKELFNTERYSIFDGKVFLYKRKESPFWWCGFHSHSQIIRTSTKQIDKSGAEKYARDWYIEKVNQIKIGEFVTRKYSFSKVQKLALEHYEELVSRNIRSQKTLDGIKGILTSRVEPYFEKIDVKNIDNTMWHKFKNHILEKHPNSSRGTLHQYKNGIRVVLNEALRQGFISSLPEFKDEYQNKYVPRPYFTFAEYKKLHSSIKSHADSLKKKGRLEQYKNAMELYDYVIFSTNTGMRVSELTNLRFCDIKVVREYINDDEQNILIISNIKGKRGTGTCKSFIGAYDAYKRIIDRRKIKDPTTSTEKVFLIHHRPLFNTILEKTKLKMANTNPPTKRDFVSLRATYICFRLLNGASISDVSFNCRTSNSMIENHYAKYLSGDLLKNINKTTWEK